MSTAKTKVYEHIASFPVNKARPKPMEAARHLCEEARVVLSSLRNGPPAVARGELAQDLRELRSLVKAKFLDAPPPTSSANSARSPSPTQEPQEAQDAGEAGEEERGSVNSETSAEVLITPPRDSHEHAPPVPNGVAQEEAGPYARPFLAVISDPRAAGPHTLVALRSLHRLLERGTLIQLGTISPYSTLPNEKHHWEHIVSLEPLMKGVLSCRFQQTDAGADEAVEMAIADLLSLVVDLDAAGAVAAAASKATPLLQRIHPQTLMEAFNTVFVTRNTFVHSPALCYHFEEVLTGMVKAAFASFHHSSSSSPLTAARSMLEFLVNQLLHTPGLNAGKSHSAASSSAHGAATASGGVDEAHIAHDATRLLCLKLIQCCLRTGWGDLEHLTTAHSFHHDNDGNSFKQEEAHQQDTKEEADEEECEMEVDTSSWEQQTILSLLQNELCLGLLMTGQSIWAHHSHHAAATHHTGIPTISLQVLSEICATLSTLWNITSLRQHLLPQFENIFTGFYQRALSLLRRRPVPDDSGTFNANLVFDAEVEIILESLVDLLCLHEDSASTSSTTFFEFNESNSSSAVSELGSGAALETLFAIYDCNMSKSDVASGLLVELCRCCGGTVGEDGQTLPWDSSTPTSTGGTGASTPVSRSGKIRAMSSNSPSQHDGMTSSSHSHMSSVPAGGNGSEDNSYETLLKWRHVPAHLKELCAEALVGSMKRLFRDAVVLPPDMLSSESSSSEPEVKTALETDETKDGEQDTNTTNESSINKLRKMSSLGLTDPADEDVLVVPPSSQLRYFKSQKRLMRRGAMLFNEKSTTGLEFLASSGIIPTPVTPKAVASFLRNGIVVGLDKRAVGEYLGTVGKGPQAGKSPPSWERDWFHQEVLLSYCSLFRFENQCLLDGLRMFLAAFRLPGEAQMIDRILQAFAESCGRTCDESSRGRLKLFSNDEKKASDGAYLLSFSIIMLNTDQHNNNIRADRKMSVEDFVKNNTDYGRDITDPDKKLPRDFLVGIYNSIREEQIRTEGEGADGVMTVERWKDVLRGGASFADDSTALSSSPRESKEGHDREDLKELILESAWLPIFSAIGGFWGVSSTTGSETSDHLHFRSTSGKDQMLGAQGARLGMDIAVEMLTGARNLGRLDIFQQMFVSVCSYSGLLGDYNRPTAERTNSFVHSVERQSAVIVAVNTAKDSGEAIGFKGWKCVWGMIFELRDLKLIGGGRENKRRSLMIESDGDLLTAEYRREWTMRLIKEGLGWSSVTDDRLGKTVPKKAMNFVFGAMGRALFGSDAATNGQPLSSDNSDVANGQYAALRTIHGKEELILWDDLAPSDDEDDTAAEGDEDDDMFSSGMFFDDEDRYRTSGTPMGNSSAGAAFESQLIHEDHLVYHYPETPITGLERLDDTPAYQLSSRARVRKRLARVCDFAGLVSESRFLSMEAIQSLLEALVHINCTAHLEGAIALSPASEALSEILICEIALKNRDRIGLLWDNVLSQHYHLRLKGKSAPLCRYNNAPMPNETEQQTAAIMTPGIEKCVTGLLRTCYWTVHREEIANKVLATLTVLYPPEGQFRWVSGNLDLDRHMAEGLWRICRNVDGLRNVGLEGWEGILGLVEWCAMRGGTIPTRQGTRGGLSEDDPALQAFRSLHLMLHAAELKDVVPFKVVGGVRALIAGGERGNCPKLSIAGLDLLLVLHTRLEPLIAHAAAEEKTNAETENAYGKGSTEVFVNCWLPVLKGMATAAELSRYASVRQHALSMLTDAIVDRHGRSIPDGQLCKIINDICVPLAGKRIAELLRSENYVEGDWEEVMIEFELSISLIFKPFLHHLKNLITVENSFKVMWVSMLGIMSHLLSDEGVVEEDQSEDPDGAMTRDKLLQTTKFLGCEHLRNAVMVLIACGVLKGDNMVGSGDENGISEDLSHATWNAIGDIDFCKTYVGEWKQAANDSGRFDGGNSAQTDAKSLPDDVDAGDSQDAPLR
uniref:SEC7 domain-containing protein n=1 Tax=Ditylum brightwellii TaxID=49249 RepID=A0A7S2EHJ5_9STRA|mmetsp:Transcript_30378/g.45173  ORF Transcript_30378/g.45173 Transcript_30378/m.45173 type:complete len:1968 (+) Transcript_30378:72-5975(+)